MNESSPRPGLLMFLHGVLVLFAIGNFFSVFVSIGGAFREIRGGSMGTYSYTFFFALITLIVFVAAIYAIGKRKRMSPFLGAGAFAFLSAHTMVTLVRYSYYPNPLLKYFSSAQYIAFMIVQAAVYLLAAFAFLFSTQIKLYFNPEQQPTDSPPPPPSTFND